MLTQFTCAKVLLVKGWQKGASWSFPRGKINKEETEGMCAVREVRHPSPLAAGGSFRPAPARLADAPLLPF